MTQNQMTEQAATLGPLSGKLESLAAAQMLTFVRRLENVEPPKALTSPQTYDEDHARYLAEAQDVYQAVQAGGDEAWRRPEVHITTERQKKRLSTLTNEWLPGHPELASLRHRAQMGKTAFGPGSLTRSLKYFNGTLEMVAAAASLEGRADYAQGCRAVGRAMLEEMVPFADEPDRKARNAAFRGLMREASTAARQIPYQSTLPNFLKMPLPQQRGLVAAIGSECLALWQLFEAHASAEDLQQVFRPRLSRPVVHLGAAVRGVDPVQRAAAVSAYISETSYREVPDASGSSSEELQPPQIGAFDEYLQSAPVGDAHGEYDAGDTDDLRQVLRNLGVADTAICSDPEERFNIEGAERRLNTFIDAIADTIHDPASADYPSQRRMNWNGKHSDFVRQLCGNRPIGIFNIRATRLAANVEELASTAEIPVLSEDTRFFRIDVDLKSTGKPPIENSLVVAVWGKRINGAMQVRKKALDAPAAKRTLALHYAKSAQAVPRTRIIARSLRKP